MTAPSDATEVDGVTMSPPNIEKPTIKTAAEKAALREKSTQGKALAEKIKNVFLAPFTRTMRFLYSGVSTLPGVFILGTDAEAKFRYGNPDQALALVHIKDPALQLDIQNWFLALGVDTHRFEVVAITDICSVLNKCKWDITRVTAERDQYDQLILRIDAEPGVVVSEPIQTYFAFQKIKDLTVLYTEALVERKVLLHPHPYRGDDQARLTKIVIDTDDLKQSGFLHLPDQGHVRTLLTRGLDWLYVKDLPPCGEGDFLGLYLWHLSGSSYVYMHTYDTAQITLTCTRCNFFLIPHILQHPIPDSLPKKSGV